jgi:hypothetical protein
MDEGATAVMDRPMIKDPERMLEIRDEVRKISYDSTKYAAERARKDGVGLPDNMAELRDQLDEQVKELSDEPERHEKLDKDGKKVVPDKVLRHMEDWREFGWSNEDKKAVRGKLRTVLGLDENACEHALESIVGAGKTPTEALQSITADAFSRAKEYFKTPEPQEGQPEQQEVQDETAELNARRSLLHGLGINDDYVRRFILRKDSTIAKSLQQEFDGQLPDNLFDLAWNIGFEKEDLFGIDGKYPVLQMQVEKYKTKDENGKEVEKVRGRYVVNQGNWMRWMRDQINWWYREYDTDVATDYFSKIEIKKGPYYSVNLVTMLFNSDRYFRDETGHKWSQLYDQTLLEPWMMNQIRQYHLDYEHNMGSEEKLAESYNNQFFLSKLTRKIYGKSMVNILMTLPEDFKGKDSDTKLGAAWTKMFLAYYNMSDIGKLKEILGEDSDFFKKEGWIKAIKEVNKEDFEMTGTPVVGDFLGARQKDFFKAFEGTKNGEIKNEKAFVDFINVFTTPVTPSTAAEVIDQALKDAIAAKIATKEGNVEAEGVDKDHDVDGEGNLIDKITLEYAKLLAKTHTLFTGVAAKNNFPSVSGHNAETKWLYPQAYRIKYAGYGGSGNPYTIPMFKQLSLPLFEGVLLENANEYYKIYEDGKLKTKSRKKTPMEIILQMHKSSEFWDNERKKVQEELKNANEDETKRLKQKLQEIDERSKNEYKIVAGQLVFNEDAMKNYAQNIIGRAKVLYEQVMSAQEINFEKFTKYDGIFRGVSFDRAEWQKAMQSGLITPLRYLFDANGATQLNMMVRAPEYGGIDEKGKPIWNHKNMPLGEAMFGHQILDIPEFRQTIKDLMPDKWKEMREKGYKWNGKNVVRPDGKNMINYDRVQENKTLAYKQWMLMKIGADLWSHIDLHSIDSAYGMEHYMNVLDAIATLPGGVEGDEYDMNGVRITKPFFSKEQMKWLKEISGTTPMKLFMRQFFADIFIGDKKKQETMFGESFGLIIGAIFKGF